MLLTSTQVNTSMGLTKDAIEKYIYDAGYTSIDILTSEFKGMTTCGEFVYRLCYQTAMTDMGDYPSEINVYASWVLDTTNDVLTLSISY